MHQLFVEDTHFAHSVQILKTPVSVAEHMGRQFRPFCRVAQLALLESGFRDDLAIQASSPEFVCFCWTWSVPADLWGCLALWTIVGPWLFPPGSVAG